MVKPLHQGINNGNSTSPLILKSRYPKKKRICLRFLSTQKSKDTVQSKVIVIVESLDHDVTFEGYKQIVLDDIQENSQNLNNIEIKSETILGKQVYISTFQQKSGSGALLPTACVSYLHKGTSFNFQITDLGIGGTTLVEGLDLVKSILVTFSTN
jgi:hypothetical protein